jgi:hypothetical protein
MAARPTIILVVAAAVIVATALVGIFIRGSGPRAPALAPTAAAPAKPDNDAAASASRAMTFTLPKEGTK